MNKYRTPDIKEFIEGFKYQVSHRFRMDIVDFSNPENTITGKWETVWYDRIVPSLKPITYPYTIKDGEGISWTFMNDSGLYDDPLANIKIGLKNKTIRVIK